MNFGGPIIFDNYTFSGDISVIALCVVIIILLLTSYVSRTRSFNIFMTIIVQLIFAAFVNIAYHLLLQRNIPSTYNLIYILRLVYYGLLFDVLFLFTLYTTVVSGMDHSQARIVAVLSSLLFVVIMGIDIVRTLMGVGFQISPEGKVLHRTNLYVIGYIAYIILLAALMNKASKLLYRRVMYGFYGTMLVSVLIRLGQLPFGQSSLTTITFVFPVIAMLYIMHSNPYNVSLGTVDTRALEEMVREMDRRDEAFIYMSLLLPEFDEEGKELPEEISSLVRQYSVDYFRKCVLFQISNGHMILIAPKRKNPDYRSQMQSMLAAFAEHYKELHYPYKIVIGESNEEISRKNEYASLIRSIERKQEENTIHRVSEADIEHFAKEEYIFRELTDIYNKRDLNDPRVLAYCQPVYNLNTKEFSSAEALMRLDLKETGIVYPDQFIPMAENHGYIHVLTEIILHKTCKEIKRLAEEGFKINRISVNISVLELKDDSFCDDISGIILDDGLTGDKVALELTESRSEADFMIMKEKINELRCKGIQFYLDDFGTGYSNMERIMELPFDIIKFDRSMVIASGTGERSEKIVENLAHMFRDMNYSVLYEGVEDDTDEERCKEMSASYLQGYKYSRPVPIEKLRDFLKKDSVLQPA